MEFEISKKFMNKSNFEKIDVIEWDKVKPGTAFGINSACIDPSCFSISYSYIFIEYNKIMNEIVFYHTISSSIARFELIDENYCYNFIIDDFREDDLNKIPSICLDDPKYAKRYVVFKDFVVFKDVILHDHKIHDNDFFKTLNYDTLKNTCDLINFKRKFILRNVKMDLITSVANIFIKDNFTTEPKVTDVNNLYKLIIRTDESRGNKIIIVQRDRWELCIVVFPKESFTPEAIETIISSRIVYILTNEKCSWDKKLWKEGEKYYRIDYNTLKIQNATFSLDNPESLYDVYLDNIFPSKLDIKKKNGVDTIKANIDFNDSFFGLNLVNKRKED